jgi:hypothetical protein
MIMHQSANSPNARSRFSDLGRLNAAAALEYWESEKPDIHWFFQFVFGLESRQADRYISRARTLQAERAAFRG